MSRPQNMVIQPLPPPSSSSQPPGGPARGSIEPPGFSNLDPELVSLVKTAMDFNPDDLFPLDVNRVRLLSLCSLCSQDHIKILGTCLMVFFHCLCIRMSLSPLRGCRLLNPSSASLVPRDPAQHRPRKRLGLLTLAWRSQREGNHRSPLSTRRCISVYHHRRFTRPRPGPRLPLLLPPR